ncbi:hypothetical protein QQP08_011232 [Theobroma cacao]|nr:hypothetical protein QQP08_011232 [Theobroma cacao]
MNRAPWSTSGLYNDLVIHLFSYHHQFNCHNTGERRDQENEEWSSFTDKPLQDSSFFDFRPSTVFEGLIPNDTKFGPSRDAAKVSKARRRLRKSEEQREVGVHENMVDPSTAAEAAETKATKERKPEKTRAQKDAHNASCRTYRLKTKRRREDLEAMVPELQAENKRMRAEIKRLKAKQGGNCGTAGANSQCMESRRPNDTNNNTTASAVAGPSCVANHGLPNNPDNNPSSHDPAAGFPTAFVVASIVAYPELASAFAALDNPSTSDLFTDHYLAAEFPTSSAAGSSLIAGHESPVMFDAPNYHDTINNLSTHDPAADNESGFSTPSAAGPSSGAYHFDFDNHNLFTDYYLAGTNGTNITPFAASGPSFPNHGLPNNAPDNNSFSHDPAPAAGSPTASALGSLIAAFPGLNYMFDDRDDHGITYLFTDHALAAEFPTSSAAGSSFIAGHESPVMFDAPNNHDTINNRSTYDPAAGNESGFPSASAAGSSSYDSGGPGLSTAFAAGSSSAANHNLHARKSYDISGLFTHDPAADNKADFRSEKIPSSKAV